MCPGERRLALSQPSASQHSIGYVASAIRDTADETIYALRKPRCQPVHVLLRGWSGLRFQRTSSTLEQGSTARLSIRVAHRYRLNIVWSNYTPVADIHSDEARAAQQLAHAHSTLSATPLRTLSVHSGLSGLSLRSPIVPTIHTGRKPYRHVVSTVRPTAWPAGPASDLRTSCSCSGNDVLLVGEVGQALLDLGTWLERFPREHKGVVAQNLRVKTVPLVNVGDSIVCPTEPHPVR